MLVVFIITYFLPPGPNSAWGKRPTCTNQAKSCSAINCSGFVPLLFSFKFIKSRKRRCLCTCGYTQCKSPNILYCLPKWYWCLKIYWPSSRVFASPGAAIDAIYMVDRSFFDLHIFIYIQQAPIKCNPKLLVQKTSKNVVNLKHFVPKRLGEGQPI